MFSEPGLFLVRPDGTLYWSRRLDDAVCAAALPRDPDEPRLRHQEQLPGPGRGVGR